MADLSKAKSIFLAASEIPLAERASFLAEAVGGDSVLRARVEALLKAHDNTDSFLEDPAAQFGATINLTPADLPLAEKPGALIGPYKLLEQIGEGGMGVVYMADQQSPVRRRVALKIIKAGMDTRQVIARFEAERQALALMDHSNIARVLDAGTTETGRPYFVMDLVKGVPITEYCDRANLSIRERLELFSQVCQAVQHAHQKGLIHRDIKPSNVLVSTQDDCPLAKVIDFGVAKAVQTHLTEKTLFTDFQQLVGTPAYMSPEQAEGSLDIDTRSDVYSLGVLLYELLAGSTPFDPKDLRSKAFAELQRIIREVEPPTPSTRLSKLDNLPNVAAHRATEPTKLRGLLQGELDWIVMKCLEKDRTRRYETASNFAADIERFLNDQPIEARPSTRLYRLRKFIRRNTAGVLAGAAVSAAIAIGLVLATVGFVQARRQANIARAEAVRADREADISRIQAVKSEQVAQFLKDMLTAAGPGVARGRDATLLREILDKTTDRLDRDLQGQPEVQGDLWFTIGTTFSDIKDFGRAATLLQHAVDNYRLAPGGDNTKLSLALASLGKYQSFTGKVADGMSNARLGLGMARRCGDPETLATCLISMGKACNFYGLEADESLPYFREAVDVYRRLGTNPVALADCLPSIARSDTEAIALWREALDLNRKHLEMNHPKVASNLDSLAQVLSAHGDYQEAERYYREALAIYRKIYEPSYPYHRSSRRGLVATIVMQEKWDEAEVVAREANDPTTSDGVDWDLLGRINAYRGRWRDAAEQLGRALERNPDMDKYRLAVALAAAGHDESYQALRRHFFDDYSTDVFPDATRALAFLLCPIEEGERAKLEQVLPLFGSRNMGPLMASRGRLDRALALCRLGQYQLALDAATPAVVDSSRLANQAQAWYIQALAGARLQHFESARLALAQGDKVLGEPARKTQGDFLEESFDWRIAEFLRAEVAELLDNAEPKSSTDMQRVDEKLSHTTDS